MPIGVAIGGGGGLKPPHFVERGAKPPHFVIKLWKQLIYVIIKTNLELHERVSIAFFTTASNCANILSSVGFN